MRMNHQLEKRYYSSRISITPPISPISGSRTYRQGDSLHQSLSLGGIEFLSVSSRSGSPKAPSVLHLIKCNQSFGLSTLVKGAHWNPPSLPRNEDKLVSDRVVGVSMHSALQDSPHYEKTSQIGIGEIVLPQQCEVWDCFIERCVTSVYSKHEKWRYCVRHLMWLWESSCSRSIGVAP